MINAIDPLLLAVLGGYSVILVLAVLLGGKLPSMVAMTHTRTQLVMSFVSGLMLGVALFHLLPHAIYTINDANAVEIVARWTMAGLLAMFLLLRVFHFHHHDMADDAHDTHCVEHSHEHTHSLGPHRLSWLGIAIGLTLHTIVDGVALAASMRADWLLLDATNGVAVLVGLGVFIAILLHKPLDAVTISTLMKEGGASKFSRRLIILLFALICPISALVVLWGLDSIATGNGIYVGSALAFSAGVFLCISLSDLLPEVHFHSHDRVKMTLVLFLGVGLALALVDIEPEHRHSTEQPGSQQHSNKQHGNKQYGNKQYGNKQYGNKQHSSEVSYHREH